CEDRALIRQRSRRRDIRVGVRCRPEPREPVRTHHAVAVYDHRVAWRRRGEARVDVLHEPEVHRLPQDEDGVLNLGAGGESLDQARDLRAWTRVVGDQDRYVRRRVPEDRIEAVRGLIGRPVDRNDHDGLAATRAYGAPRPDRTHTATGYSRS